ncbi:MAG: Gfo/Idh/MocA family oxidoreductase [Bryobacterales bacterium]|nr:Gfo/Idh/MocA family oxidoreductase [Acidobacteriota bacterium]MCB9385768.1 Gfo/Idh/MocA family oxidoreductase [Bryobacterales bacterium]
MNRRTFVQSAAAFAAATQARPILGANDRVNLCVVGVGGRGRDHIQYFSDLPNLRIAAVVDVNQAARERAEALVNKLQGHKPKLYSDMREAFDSKDINAVSTATPNHWHALTTIWACQAGKDIYAEKPASHDIYEGKQMIAAARKYDRIVQTGSQSRSIAHKREAIQMLREGVVGDIYMVRGLCYRRRNSIGHTPEEPPPPGLDWPFFLGPAPMRPYTKNRFAYNWHWFWDTGNGDIGNQGVHEMDISRWALGLGPDDTPIRATSSGGKFVWQDDQETPNTQQALFDFPGKEIYFDVRNLDTNVELPAVMGKSVVGNLIFGSKGVMCLHPEGVQVYIGDEREKTVDNKYQEERVWDPRPHMQNFLDAVRAKDRSKLHAEIADGVASAALCHYANASYRLNRVIQVDPKTGMAAGDREADKLLERRGRSPYQIPEKV